MVHEETRPSLLLRLRSPDDGDAWAEFDRIYRDLLYAYLVRRGTSSADADEIYADVLVQMNRSLPRFEYQPARGHFRDYLRRAVDNAILTRFRRQRTIPDHLDTAVAAGIDSPDSAALAQAWEEEWRAFHSRRAMRALRREYDARSLDAFESLIDGQTVAEVARRMKMTEPAVHKVKQRFRDRMREIIRRQVAQEDGA